MEQHEESGDTREDGSPLINSGSQPTNGRFSTITYAIVRPIGYDAAIITQLSNETGFSSICLERRI